MKTCHILLFLAALGGAATAPAQDFFARKTPAPAANEAQRENARAELLLQQVERLAGQVNELRQDTAQLEQRATQAEQQLLKNTTALQNENAKLRDETKTLRDDVKALRNELAQVKADRETLRKQITDDLAARITAAVEKQAAANTAPQRGTKETGRLHVVEAGQTLSEIAAAYKSSVAVIMRANNMANPNQLRIGQELFIPDP